MISPPVQITVETCKQNALPAAYKVTSRLVILLKFSYDTLNVFFFLKVRVHRVRHGPSPIAAGHQVVDMENTLRRINGQCFKYRR